MTTEICISRWFLFSLYFQITWRRFYLGDVKIADHNFKPKQMSPFGGGYMGDYIGITQTVGKSLQSGWMIKAAPVGSNKPTCWAEPRYFQSNNLPGFLKSRHSLRVIFILEYTGTQLLDKTKHRALMLQVQAQQI